MNNSWVCTVEMIRGMTHIVRSEVSSQAIDEQYYFNIETVLG